MSLCHVLSQLWSLRLRLAASLASRCFMDLKLPNVLPVTFPPMSI